MPHILKVDSSARHDNSKSRPLTEQIARKLADGGTITARDVAETIPHVSEPWTQGAYMAPDDRNPAQAGALVISDTLVDELVAADILVIGAPIYNFGMPAALKAWFDQICRMGRTFKYTDQGPKGLLEGKKAYIVVTSGGVPVDSPMDFATPHLRHLMGFIGIEDVTVVEAAGLMGDEEAGLAKAQSQIEAIAA